jgi:intracellular septation protein
MLINSLGVPAFVPAEPSQAIYFATFIAIIASALSVLIHYWQERNLNKNQTITFLMFVIFGGSTLLLRDPAFIQWKPSVINMLFAVIFIGSAFIGEKTMIERLMSGAIQAPKATWRRLNMAWVSFFVTVAGLNLYVAYQFSEQTWVNFKLFGMLGLTFAFLVGQMVILNRYITIKPEE